MLLQPKQPSDPLLLVLDDDDDLREGLTWMFETSDIRVQGFARFGDFQPLLESLLNSGRPLCLLLDLRMPEISGLEVFHWLKKQGVSLDHLPVIFLTGHGDISTAVETVKEGAFDFYEKPATDVRLIDRVCQAFKRSKEFLDGQIVQRQWTDRVNRLSPRERQVMFYVARGTLNKVIASELDISMRTVEVHRANVFEKLKVRSAAELATLLGRLGEGPVGA